MIKNQMLRAWKNPAYRREMSISLQDNLKRHPASTSDIDPEVLNNKPDTGTAVGTALCSPCPPRMCY